MPETSREESLMMSDVHNSNWIVSEIRFTRSRNGRLRVTRCGSRSFRVERYARRHFREIKRSLEDVGFEYYPIEVTDPRAEYEGFYGFCLEDGASPYTTIYSILYIDRNPG
jgi:hypothetical protein